jgi:hypothetical protein
MMARGTFHVAAIIRMPSARHELHVGGALQIVDRGRPGSQKRRAQLAARGVSNQRVQIFLGLFGAVVEAGLFALPIAGNP